MVPLNIFPNKLYTLLIGLGILGFSQEMIFVNALPEIIESLGNVNDNTTNRISGVLNFAGLISQSASQIIGGQFYDLFGYQQTMQISMYLMIACFLIYLLFNRK